MYIISMDDMTPCQDLTKLSIFVFFHSSIGLVVGFMLTSILMGVVGSAVNTVIVCYAEAPNEFQTNHPQLSADMRQSWRQAWPTEFKY
jgi:hypothetical protein